MTDPLLRVDDLHVRPASPEAQRATGGILEGVDLVVASGEVHAILGPAGSGTSTLGSTLMGSPDHEVTAGSVTFRGDDVTDWPVDERAKAGMFLAFRSPQAVAGVTMIQFLRHALSARKGVDRSMSQLRTATTDWTRRLGLESNAVDHVLNEGCSDSERHRNEIVQMAILEPELAILDETGSGLDIDALQTVATGIREVRNERESMSVVLISHHQQLLDEVAPDRVHILMHGRIVASGGMELAAQLERDGYGSFCTGAAA